VTTGNPANASALFNASASQGAAARDAFNTLGDQLDERRDRKATAAAVEQALQTGQIDASDPNADLSLVTDILGSEADRELTGVQTQGATLDNQLAQFDLDNADEREKLATRVAQADINQSNAAVRASDARTKAAGTENRLNQALLNEQNRQTERAAYITAANQAMADHRKKLFDEELTKLKAGNPYLDDASLEREANDIVDEQIGREIANGVYHTNRGITADIFWDTAKGQEVQAVRLRAAEQAFQTAQQGAKLTGKAAEGYQKNFEAAMQGTPEAFRVNTDGELDIRTNTSPNRFSQAQLKGKIGGAFKDATKGTNVTDVSDIDGMDGAIESLSLLDKSLANRFLETAIEKSGGDLEKVALLAQYQAQRFMHETQGDRGQKLVQGIANRTKGVDSRTKLALASGFQAQTPPVEGKGFFATIDAELNEAAKLSTEEIGRRLQAMAISRL
jgi:hypothetical protein